MSRLKRIAAPASWPIQRKEHKYIAKPMPGPHSLETSLPLGVILRDLMKRTHIARETKKILHDGNVLVNGIARKEERFPVGLFDIIAIPKTNDYYTIHYNTKGKFVLVPIGKEHAAERVCRIRNKTTLKKNLTQLNLYDGTSILADKKDYKPGDSILMSAGKIKKHLKLEKGALIYLTGGKHVGETAVLESIHVSEGITPNKMTLKMGDKKIETIQDYAYVIEKEIKR